MAEKCESTRYPPKPRPTTHTHNDSGNQRLIIGFSAERGSKLFPGRHVLVRRGRREEAWGSHDALRGNMTRSLLFARTNFSGRIDELDARGNGDGDLGRLSKSFDLAKGR